MKQTITFILFNLFVGLSLFAQNNENYRQILSRGEPPAYIKKSASEKQAELNVRTSPYRQKEERLEEINFYMSSNYWMNDLLSSGDVIYGELTHKYLSAVLLRILTTNNIKDEIFIHGVKSGVVNAFASDLGLLFVNFGVLSTVRNEAELAFIIAHELAHYILQHNLEGVLKDFKTEKYSENNTISSYEKILSKHSYSRERELQADSLGLVYFIKAGYKAVNALSVFELLNNPAKDFDTKILNGLIDFDQKISNYKYKSRDSIANKIRVDTTKSDKLSTHPSTNLRINRINEYLKNQNSTGENFIVSEREFNEIKSNMNLELCRLSLFDKDYCSAFYYGSFIYFKNENYKKYGAITLTRALIGLLQMKFDENRLTHKNAMKISDLNLSSESPFFNMVSYIRLQNDMEFAIDIIKTFKNISTEFAADEEMMVLNNGVFEYIIKNFKNFKDDHEKILNGLEKINVSNQSKESKKEILLDPFYLTADIRKEYVIDYTVSENNLLKINDIIETKNLSAKKYEIISVADKKEITTEDLNFNYILKSRVSEQYDNKFNPVTAIPIDYNEIKLICDSLNTQKLKYSFGITVFRKGGNSLIYYIIFPLLPIGIYKALTPVSNSYFNVITFDLLSGKELENKEYYFKSKINSTKIESVYFNN